MNIYNDLEIIEKMRGKARLFWKRVIIKGKDECWEWSGTKDGHGYGKISMLGRGYSPVKAPRVSWVLHYGAIPDGMYICHICDNPSCVNPQHLMMGTPKDNTQDMWQKGRDNHVSWGNAWARKLTPKDVVRIREIASVGNRSNRSLGLEYGVSGHTIGEIIKRKTWKGVTI